ncbi:MAG TPA: serine/threonine-protein kinase [Polyangiaceae bacterium]|nr:serine/threonine-protein kinase [Polyangiaceae bacterium]
MANRTALKPGDTLGRFQLLVPIGAGGMGRVWVAREQGLTARPRLVAIKTALAEEAASEDYWKVLLDEARIASQIQHPNVCAIHALDRERGVVYLVMDWSDGGSLREVLDATGENRLPVHIAARLVAHVCAGLQAAHDLVGDDGVALGVVHRDVSPQNILLSSNGQVKLTDFGVAKARGQIHAPTQTGEVKGKLSYMAPEQVTTRDVDRRADVFALGCVLYEATVGERPFHGDDALSTLYQLLERPVQAPTSKRLDYPVGLERIVLKSLERDPEARYQTAEEMGRALQMWLASERTMVTDSDMAELVRVTLGDRIAARAKAVEEALVVVDSPEIDADEPEQEAPAKPGVETLSGSAASTLPGNQLPRAPRKTLWAGVASAAVALSLVAAFAGNRGSQQPLPNPVASATPAPLAAPAPVPAKEAEPARAEDVTITLRVSPDNASLTLDDGPPLPNPYTIRVAPDARQHHVRAHLAGYEDHEETVVFDQSRQLSFALSKQTGGAPRGRAPAVRVASVTNPTPPADTPAAPTQPTAPRNLGELPPVVKKPPRALDAENPFAKP